MADDVASSSGVSTLSLIYHVWFLVQFLLPGERPRPEASSASSGASSSAADALEQDQYGAKMGEEWSISCGMNMVIFTDCYPDDLLAIYALFERANSLKCPLWEYPIKGIIGGGGASSMSSHLMLQAYLTDLRTIEIVPKEHIFSIGKTVLPGPPALDYENPGYDNLSFAFVPDFAPIRQDPFGSLIDNYPGTMELLKNLHDPGPPTLVAMRPMFEFALSYANVIHDGGVNWDFAATRDYIHYRDWIAQAFLEDMEDADSKGKGKATSPSLLRDFRRDLAVFAKSTVVMYQANATNAGLGANFADMGQFFATYILNRTASSAFDVDHHVRLLEASLVDMPRQFLLLDRPSLVADDPDGEKRHFTAERLPEVFELMRRALPAALFSRVIDLTRQWNAVKVARHAQIIRAVLRRSRLWRGPEYSERLLARFTGLQADAFTLSEQLARGVVKETEVNRWKTKVRAFALLRAPHGK
ncbi:MAG: hypothetical protein M1838_003756 [Thelocarpon superellum]|nr:MAG: hypothetical protein M1838_003756 [Thelocarpon superellum]